MNNRTAVLAITPDARESLAHQVAAALTAGTGMLALALVFALIALPRGSI